MGTLLIKLNPDDFTDDFVDTFVAHRISQLTICGAPELSDRRRTWLSEFIFNSCFHFHLKDGARAFLFNYLRRVEAASAMYVEARKALIEYLDHLATRVTGASHYFHSLMLFETCVSQMYQAAELLYLPLGIKLSDAGDDVQRLYKLYKDAKHMAGVIKGGMLPKGSPCCFWITNIGLGSSRGSMTFTELCGMLEELANYADQVSEMEWLRKKNFESLGR
jgi:hypothetical protein